MPNKQAPHPRRATQGTTATCVPCAHRCTGVQQRETESSSGLQGDVSKANQQETPNFLLPALSCFFSILIVHLFRSFRLLRNTNPSWSFSFVSIHILVLVYC